MGHCSIPGSGRQHAAHFGVLSPDGLEIRCSFLRRSKSEWCLPFLLGRPRTTPSSSRGTAAIRSRSPTSQPTSPARGPSQGGGIGNFGVGGTGKSTARRPVQPSTAASTSRPRTPDSSPTIGVNAISGGVNYSVAAVTSALNTVNALNTTLGALTGTNTTINGNTTINASNGTSPLRGLVTPM